MATQFINTDISGPGNRVYLSNDNDLWVGRNGLVGTTTDFFDTVGAILGEGSNHTVHIEGAVAGYNGVELGDNVTLDSNNAVVIASTGVVYGANFGVVMFGINARLDNFGLISGGVYFQGSGPGLSRIDNAGDIISNLRAVFHEGTETLSLNNTGTIRGDVAAFLSTFATTIDLIRNQGGMIGNIVLGGGDDLYDGRGGFVDGIVFGEAGNDTFRPGSGIELFDGGAGIDTLDFRSTAGVRVYLDGSGQNTGTAAGDDYTAIETVLGSATGNDFLAGDSGNNILRGLGGVDTLSGGSGIDNLGGGAGIDRLTGGAGNDGFVFQTLSECGDVITDFRNLVGDNDAVRIGAAGFGGGLLVGALAAAQFQTRADNLAQDSNDRFIFRTTDQTLWFDANGNVAGGLTLVADLQTGAVVTAADILIF